jgi:formylmethanofuran dehydrogenase subunit E
MSVLAMRLLEIDDPAKYHRKLIVVAETDRCLPDVLELVLGCRLGNRSLKFKDWGKMAASFLDLARNRAFRVAAQGSIELEARRSFSGLPRDETLTKAYMDFPDKKLFKWRPVVLEFAPEDLPGHHAKRVICQQCGEGIGFRREVRKDGLTLCRACAGEAYWLPGGTA